MIVGAVSNGMSTVKGQRGVNLIELMIVVVIVGIIAMFAYPSYLEQIRSAKRADCLGALVSLGSAMERHYSVSGSYLAAAAAGADTGVPAVFATSCPVDGSDANYTLTIQSATASTYSLNATPAGAQVADRCGTLSFTNTGVKGVVGADGGVTWQDCW